MDSEDIRRLASTHNMTCTLPFNSPADGKPCFYEEKNSGKNLKSNGFQWVYNLIHPMKLSINLLVRLT
jgi:hypothetical protein